MSIGMHVFNGKDSSFFKKAKDKFWKLFEKDFKHVSVVSIKSQ